jgi:hypothetical protein
VEATKHKKNEKKRRREKEEDICVGKSEWIIPEVKLKLINMHFMTSYSIPCYSPSW